MSGGDDAIKAITWDGSEESQQRIVNWAWRAAKANAETAGKKHVAPPVSGWFDGAYYLQVILSDGKAARCDPEDTVMLLDDGSFVVRPKRRVAADHRPSGAGMSPPPSSIEEAAKRVKELGNERERSMTHYYAHTRARCFSERNLAAEMGALASQLAEWVEKAVPIIKAARRISACSSLTVTFAPVDGEDQGYALWIHTDEGRATLADLATSLATLDTPSSLAAELAHNE